MLTTLLAIIIVIGGVVLAHELGHFVMARLTRMRVEAFSIGFPPKLFHKKIGETEYRLSLIPLGGYVKVTGVIDESLDVENTEIDKPWSFATKKWWQKVLFISGGVIFNMLLAIVIFSGMTLSEGIYEPSQLTTIDSVMAGMPADSVGIKAGDVILAVNGQPVATWEELSEQIHAHPHDSIWLTWQSGNVQKEARLLPVSQKILKKNRLVEVGLIGISPIINHREANFFEAIGAGCATTYYWFKITVISLKMLISGQESLRNIGGPIFIAQLAGQSARSGIGAILGLMAIISVNLALINILPVPAFDGGHLLIVTIEAIIGKPLSTKAKIRIQQVGLVIIVLLTLLVLYNDLIRLFKW
jgi:regulator of sigma E protease